MKGRYYVAAAGALVLLLPLLVTPAGWALAGVLVGLWLLVTVVGPPLASRYLDLKESRESGVTAKQIQDRVGGDDDQRRWRR